MVYVVFLLGIGNDSNYNQRHHSERICNPEGEPNEFGTVSL